MAQQGLIPWRCRCTTITRHQRATTRVWRRLWCDKKVWYSASFVAMKIKMSESCWRIGEESTLPSPERVSHCSGWEVRLHSWETSCWGTLSLWWKKRGGYLSFYESSIVKVARLHIPNCETVIDEVLCSFSLWWIKDGTAALYNNASTTDVNSCRKTKW